MNRFIKKRIMHLLHCFTILVFWATVIYGAYLEDTQNPIPDSASFITWSYGDTAMGLYTPASSGSKKLPVVMFLHSCNNNPVHRNLWIINALNAIEPCAVFIPTAPPDLSTQYPCADWGGTYDQALRPNMVNALNGLDSLVNMHDFDASRVYLYGESMGGEGVYRLLSDFPTRFAGGVVASGYTENKGAEKMAKTPLWIFHGSDDNIASVDNARNIYESIKGAGGTLVNYTEYEGSDHVSAINKVHYEDGVLEWLLSQKRTNAIVKRHQRNDIYRSFDLVYCKSGNLHLSGLVPLGAVLSLFGLNGELIYQTAIFGSRVTLPKKIRNRFTLWHIANSTLFVSGKIMPLGR